MPNPWSAWTQFWEQLNVNGRAKFERLASDEERNTATIINVIIMAAFITAIVTGLYFVLYTILLLVMGEIDLRLLFMLLHVSFTLGWTQGGALGAILGYSQAQLWQGKRNKAGTVCALGAATVLALMALWQLQFYDEEFPWDQFLFWAVLLFSPGYLAASCLISYGLKLLND